MAQLNFSQGIKALALLVLLLFTLSAIADSTPPAPSLLNEGHPDEKSFNERHLNESHLDQAKTAIRTRQYKLAHQLLLDLAHAEDIEAQYLLASLYSSGKGIKRNYQTSAFWLSQAAEHNHLKAQYSLGMVYENGKGRKKDLETALSWYQKAADSGHRQAKNKIEALSSRNRPAPLSLTDSRLILFSLIRKNNIDTLKSFLERYIEANHDIDATDKYGTTALIFSVEKKHPEIAKLFMLAGASPDHRNQHGQSAIDIAAKNNYPSIMKIMLAYQPKLNSQDQLGNTGLHLAAKKNHTEIVRLILGSGGNPNLTNNNGHTVLDIAIKNRNKEISTLLKIYHAERTYPSKPTNHRSGLTESLLAKNARLQSSIAKSNKNPFKNWPALNLAAWRGQTEHVRSLLGTSKASLSIEVDSLDEERHTPLSRAAWQGHTEIVSLLLSAGANPDHSYRDDLTPLYLAVESGHYETTKELLKSGTTLREATDKESLIMIASRKAYQPIALELIKYEAQLDTVYKGKTVLMWAAQNGMDELLTQIIKSKIDLNRKDPAGRTALSLAILSQQENAVKLLVNAGANCTLQDHAGTHPLERAAQLGNLTIVNSLLQNLSHVNEANAQKNTPLILAAQRGYTDIMEALIKKGADIKHRNKTSHTAIMLASKNGHLSAVKLLLKYGADPKRKNSDGNNSAQLALLAHQEDLADFLTLHSDNNSLLSTFR